MEHTALSAESNESKLKKIKQSMGIDDNLYVVSGKNAERFEADSRKEGKGTIAIMTYGDQVVYLRADSGPLPEIPLSQFNYTSGTFEKKWGADHKTIVLTPNRSSIRKVELEIRGMDISKMRLLPGGKGDVIEDDAKIRITRHYRFSEGGGENKKDAASASPGESSAR